ncbi:MAG TPA: hypothetical protein VIG99_15270 [Myxococcaceae bacterium]
MSAPKPSTILLVLALLAVVVLFVVAVGVRAPDTGTVDKEQLKERWLGGVKKVAPGDLEGDACRGPLRSGQTCAFEVKGAWSLSRSLPVRSTDAVTVVLQAKGQGRKVPVELKRPGTNQRVDLQIGQRGARVEITCRAPVNPQVGCLVQVGS